MLVDLAGSERLSFLEQSQSSGRHKTMQKETININKSLMALRKVINALLMKQKTGQQQAFVPYRESKLTAVLR